MGPETQHQTPQKVEASDSPQEAICRETEEEEEACSSPSKASPSPPPPLVRKAQASWKEALGGKTEALAQAPALAGVSPRPG